MRYFLHFDGGNLCRQAHGETIDDAIQDALWCAAGSGLLSTLRNERSEPLGRTVQVEHGFQFVTVEENPCIGVVPDTNSWPDKLEAVDRILSITKVNNG